MTKEARNPNDEGCSAGVVVMAVGGIHRETRSKRQRSTFNVQVKNKELRTKNQEPIQNRRFEPQRANSDFVIRASFVIGYFVIRHLPRVFRHSSFSMTAINRTPS
jgi:hypothetical protein